MAANVSAVCAVLLVVIAAIKALLMLERRLTRLEESNGIHDEDA